MFEWLKRLFKKKNNDEDFDWDWDDTESLKLDKKQLNLSDPEQMERYIRSCCDQMKESTEEIDKSVVEFRSVTERLTDMEELEQLPLEIRQEIRDGAARLLETGQKRKSFTVRKDAMPEEQYRLMERHEEDFPEAIKELIQNEEYRTLVKKDLQNLEGEKVSYRFRRAELMDVEKSSRELVIVVLFAAVLALLGLGFLQLELHMQVRLGYMLLVAIGAISLTALFIRFNDAKLERKKIEKKINQAISVQNTVKIRYVNATAIIEYAYVKYGVNSSNELNYIWEKYLVEKKERESVREADEALAASKEALLELLTKNRVKNAQIWLGLPEALVDPREMVEIRHELVARRGSLRKRIEYNEGNRKSLSEEVTELVRKYPSQAELIMGIVKEYD